MAQGASSTYKTAQTVYLWHREGYIGISICRPACAYAGVCRQWRTAHACTCTQAQPMMTWLCFKLQRDIILAKKGYCDKKTKRVLPSYRFPKRIEVLGTGLSFYRKWSRRNGATNITEPNYLEYISQCIFLSFETVCTGCLDDALVQLPWYRVEEWLHYLT